MKKHLTLAVLFLAGIASAASFSWTTGNTNPIKFDGTTITTGATAYLVALGTSTDSSALWSIDTAAGTLSGASHVDYSAPKTTPALLAGTINKTYNDSGSGAIAVDNTFGMYITYTDANNVTWYNFAESVLAASTDTAGRYNTMTYSFDFTKKNEINVKSGEKPTAGGGWYAAVPEPSVALMGLLGIGMLLKRRRA